MKKISWVDMRLFYFSIFIVILFASIAYSQGEEYVQGPVWFFVGEVNCSSHLNSGDCLAFGCCWCNACQDCPCPTPSPPPAPPGGGGGGGIGGAFITENKTNLTTYPLSLTTDTIDIRLYPGEYKTISLGITNNVQENKTMKLSVEGEIWPFTLFDRDTFSVKAGGIYTSNIKFYTLPTTIPGTYRGNIVVKSGNITRRISVNLRIEYETEKLLDIKIDPMTKDVNPGDRFKYIVTLYNLGLTKTMYIFINYTIRGVDNNVTIAKTVETVAMQNSISLDRSLLIPNETETGTYIIEAVATYEDRMTSAIASFNVVKPFWLIPLLWSLLTNWMTYVVIFVLIPSLYFAKKVYERVRMKRIYKARYVRPVDINKLPKSGLYVGKVSETNTNAYIDPDDLTTHLIVAGGTGSGKSVSSMVIAEELLKKDVPVIVFDPTAQWTGFIRPCTDSKMFKIYSKFGMKKEEARPFKGTILQVTDPFMKVEVDKYIKKGEITVFVLNKLTPEQLDYFVRKTIDYMFTISWPESRELKVLMVYDEVHRLLPKYVRRKVSSLEGGGYIALERACREFRKWGIGLVMISQVLLDFKGAIRAVIATETQMRTKYEGDINRIKTKYGWQYSISIPKLEVGTGLIQNPAYNNGKPWFITFRPLLHDTFRITDQDLESYEKFDKQIQDLRAKMEELKNKKIDTYDMELEISLAEEKTKTGQLRMAETYIESVKSRIDNIEKRKGHG